MNPKESPDSQVSKELSEQLHFSIIGESEDELI